MKKITKYLSFIFVFFIAFVCANCISAHAADMTFVSSTSFSNPSWDKMNLYKNDDNAGSTFKVAKLGNNYYAAYCFNHTLEAPDSGAILTKRALTTNEKDKIYKLNYALEHGFHCSTNDSKCEGGSWDLGNITWTSCEKGKTLECGHTFTTQEKYYVTQLVIWGLLGEEENKGKINSNFKGIDLNALYNKYKSSSDSQRKKIVNTAYRYFKHVDAQQPATYSLAISPKSNTLVLNGNYYEASFSVAFSGNTSYGLSLIGASNDAFVVDANGKEYKNITSNEAILNSKTFTVKIPKASVSTKETTKFSVKVTGQKATYNLAVYQASNDRQDVGIAIHGSQALSDQATVSYTPKENPKGSFRLKKLWKYPNGDNWITKNKLIGAEFKICHVASNKCYTWTVTNESQSIDFKNVAVGEYTITETKSPEGFTKIKDTKIIVKDGDTIDKNIVELANYLDQKIEVSKLEYGSNNKCVKGVKLQIKDSNGKVVEQWNTSDENGCINHKISTKLAAGVYTLVEAEYPKYYKQAAPISFTIDDYGRLFVNGKKTNNIIMYNVLVDTIEISKVDVYSSQELSGATLVLKDENGKEIEKWVSGGETKKLRLADGKYVLYEEIVPKGYEATRSTVHFTVAAGVVTSVNGTATTLKKIVIQNKPKKNPIVIKKVDINGFVELDGAKMNLKKSDGTLIAEWYSDGNTKSFQLDEGDYILTEISSPMGYIMSDRPYSFHVDKFGKITSAPDNDKYTKTVVTDTSSFIYIGNEKKENKPVDLCKTDIIDGSEIAGAKMELYDSLGLIKTWTSQKGACERVTLEPGTYKLVETQAPEGYDRSSEYVIFTVKDDETIVLKDGSTVGADRKIIMTNTPKTNVKISKQDITTSKELPGATLTVKDKDGKILDTWVSTTEPHYIKVKLSPGTYKLIETKSPAGYGLSEEVVDFEVGDSGIEQTVVMTNSPIPVTADIPMPLIIAGIVTAVGFAGYCMVKYAKQGVED